MLLVVLVLICIILNITVVLIHSISSFILSIRMLLIVIMMVAPTSPYVVLLVGG